MNKIAVVTGAGGGIGMALVGLFLSENWTVIAISRDSKKLRRLKEKYSSLLKVVEVDFLQPDFLNQLKMQMVDIERLDVLINNAGLLINKPFEQVSIQEIQNLIMVNYTAALAITQQCLPALKKTDQAHVVNISTMGAVQGSMKFPGLSIYASTKAAICTFTEVMAEEYKKQDISFNCLALGSVDTDMFKDAFPENEANVSAETAAKFIVDFAINKRELFNGKIIPVAPQTP